MAEERTVSHCQLIIAALRVGWSLGGKVERLLTSCGGRRESDSKRRNKGISTFALAPLSICIDTNADAEQC